MLGLCSAASRRNCCTARCCSIWYRFFKRLSPFSWQKKLTLGYYGRGVRVANFYELTGNVVAKAEHLDGKEKLRFVLTSFSSAEWAAQALDEKLYCARGDMGNRIKEQFSLLADRVNTETMRANQMRFYLSTMA